MSIQVSLLLVFYHTRVLVEKSNDTNTGNAHHIKPVRVAKKKSRRRSKCER